MTIAEELVARWHGLSMTTVPPSIRERAALCFEDTIGISLAAAAQDVGTAGTRVAAATAPGPSTIWGTGAGVSAGEAAFANGMLAHAMDFDDLHGAAIMHSSAVIVPTAIALGEQVGANAAELLGAAIIGYEVAARLGRLAPGPFQQHGFQSTSVLGVFAAASIAARLTRLSAEQAVSALGIAGSMASGLMEFLADGSDVKQMHPGWAAHSGIRAAQLAAAGFKGPATVFEGRFGVFRSFARTDVDARPILADTAHWEVSEMAPKPYPACLCVHPQVQAILQLRERGEIAPDRLDEIEEIACEVPAFYVGLVYEPKLNKASVRTAYEGRFSAAYCMARALLDGRLDVSSFNTQCLDDPRVHEITSKVTYRCVELPEYPASFPARIIVTKTDGRKVQAYVAHNLGSPGNPLTAEQIGQKFLACAEPAVGRDAATRLWTALRGLAQPGGEKSFYAALRQTRVEKKAAPTPEDVSRAV